MAVCHLLAAPPKEVELPCDRPQQKEMTVGYDCEFFKPIPAAFQTECPICKMVLRDPHQCRRCGKNFCHSCTEHIQGEHKPCPHCQETNFEVFQDKGMRQCLNKLDVLCTHSKEGCKWKGRLEELEDHIIEVTHPGKAFIHTCGPGRSKSELVQPSMRLCAKAHSS